MVIEMNAGGMAEKEEICARDLKDLKPMPRRTQEEQRIFKTSSRSSLSVSMFSISDMFHLTSSKSLTTPIFHFSSSGTEAYLNVFCKLLDVTSPPHLVPMLNRFLP